MTKMIKHTEDYSELAVFIQAKSLEIVEKIQDRHLININVSNTFKLCLKYANKTYFNLVDLDIAQMEFEKIGKELKPHTDDHHILDIFMKCGIIYAFTKGAVDDEEFQTPHRQFS